MPQESSVSPFRASRAANPTDRNRTEARLDHRAASPLVNVWRRDIILVPPTIHQATKGSKPSNVVFPFISPSLYRDRFRMSSFMIGAPWRRGSAPARRGIGFGNPQQK